MNTKLLVSLLVCSALFASCSKETVEPEYFGAIEGQVIDSETRTGIANVSISTQPATDVLLTDGEGRFELPDVATGNYLIKAEKKGYLPKSANINVREDQVSTAMVVMDADEKEQGSAILQAEVTSWSEWSINDSVFVDVEYRLSHTGQATMIEELEVYFGIYTNASDYYYEVRDSSMSAGESSFGSFTKYIHRSTVDSVVITGTWTSN